MRLLTRKFGKVTLKTLKRLDKLSAEQLEELAEAVLDFEKVADLEAWLPSKKKKGSAIRLMANHGNQPVHNHQRQVSQDYLNCPDDEGASPFV